MDSEKAHPMGEVMSKIRRVVKYQKIFFAPISFLGYLEGFSSKNFFWSTQPVLYVLYCTVLYGTVQYSTCVQCTKI